MTIGIKLSLKQVVLTSQFSEIGLGTDIKTVETILGVADDVSTGKPPKIWRYGSFQVTLFEQQVIGASLFFSPSNGLSPFEAPLNERKLYGAEREVIEKWIRAIDAAYIVQPQFTIGANEGWKVIGQDVSLRFVDGRFDSIGIYSW
jgi:hypothetical protein